MEGLVPAASQANVSESDSTGSEDDTDASDDGTLEASPPADAALRRRQTSAKSGRSQVDLINATLDESWVRYVTAELVGTFILSVMNGLFAWGVFFHGSIEFKKANQNLNPTLELECVVDPVLGNRTCSGEVHHPLAGANIPGNTVIMCLFTGLAFACVSLLAPGATFNPSFALMLCVGKMKRWSLFLPSCAAQIVGVVLADWLIYLLLLQRMFHIANLLELSPKQALMAGEMFFGVAYPSPAFNNYFAFFYAVFANVIFVFLMMPMAIRCHRLPSAAQEVSKGVVIGIFAAAFGVNGLGSLPNPATWIGGAIFLSTFNYPLDIWARNNYYALKVPFWAPTIGIFLGSALASCYLWVLYRRPELEAPAAKESKREPASQSQEPLRPGAE